MLFTIGAVVAIGLGFPGHASADSAGPTDYETEIVDIVPPADGAARFSIEGGDAFVRVITAPGHELLVLGYDGEPYIRIDDDGTVWENQRSESYYYNLERYGGDVPDAADSTAPPEWVEVDDDGEHAWHDHRAHWMAEFNLIGIRPGDSLPPDEIDMIIDGRPTVLTVKTTLQARAWPGWLAIGVVAGLVAAVVAGTGRLRGELIVGSVVGVAATLVGVGHTLSVPASTGRPLWWWLPPLVAVATMVVATRFRNDPTLVGAIGVGVGIELIVWGWFGIDGLLDAYRPTVLPVNLERVVTTAIPVAGVGLVIGGVRIWLSQRRPSTREAVRVADPM